MLDARINIKTESHIKYTLEKAASLNGQNLSSFLLQNGLSTARSIIKESKQIELSNASITKILDLLDNTPQPNKKLKQLLNTKI